MLSAEPIWTKLYIDIEAQIGHFPGNYGPEKLNLFLSGR